MAGGGGVSGQPENPPGYATAAYTNYCDQSVHVPCVCLRECRRTFDLVPRERCYAGTCYFHKWVMFAVALVGISASAWAINLRSVVQRYSV